MSRNRRRIVRTIVAALGVAVAVGSNAPAQAYPSLPPRALRDAPTVTAAPAGQDLRSPDARDAARTADTPSGQLAKWIAYDKAVSRLTPDQRTAALSGGSPATTTTATTHASGTDWNDIGIIAGGVLAAILVAFGGMFLLTRHPASRTRVVSS